MISSEDLDQLKQVRSVLVSLNSQKSLLSTLNIEEHQQKRLSQAQYLIEDLIMISHAIENTSVVIENTSKSDGSTRAEDGGFVELDKGKAVCDNYRGEFNRPGAQGRIPLFDNMMFRIDASLIKELATFGEGTPKPAKKIRVYPGIKLPDETDRNRRFTLIFAAESEDDIVIPKDSTHDINVLDEIEPCRNTRCKTIDQ